MTTQQKIFKGTMLAIFAGILWGVSGIFGQLFFEATMVMPYGLPHFAYSWQV